MTSTEWFADSALWMQKRNIIFYRDRLLFTFMEVDHIIRLTNISGKASILDLCCGIGRHAIQFSRRGFEVTGIDITPEYLAIACDNARRENVPVDFLRGDMREEFGDNVFDLIINMFTSFGYFSDPADDRKVIGNCYQALKKNGKLLIEVIGKEVLAAHFNASEVQEFDGYKISIDNKLSQDWGWLESTWNIEKDNSINELSYAHRLYSAAEMRALLSDAGFRDIKFYGDISGKSKYDHTAKLMVVVAQK